MKVLHLVTGLEVGGAEQQLRLMLPRLPYRCDVVSLSGDGPVGDGIRADGGSVLALDGPPGLPRLVRLIRRGDYDVVHTHRYRACVTGRIAARLAGVRGVVATAHTLGATEIDGRPLTRRARARYRRTERLGTATVAVSEPVADRLRRLGVPGERIETLAPGVDADAFRYDPAARAAVRARLGLAADAFVIGGAGRLVPGKRFDVLIRAVAQVPDARLVLAGDGPERAALRRAADQFGVGNRVLLPGAWYGGGGVDGDPGLPALFSALDVLVAPAPAQAFGTAVVEALAAGLPVVHTGCPALDGLPGEPVPGARRTGARSHLLAAVLREERLVAPRRLPPPPLVARYGADRAARALAALHERAAGCPPPAAGAGVPQPAAPPETAASDPSLTG
ncbi:glycosyltransferase [Streptomyces catenulae]|uniref:D-inositol 3-phosphate glycosyltransferase n=1 Tax=Streptomyces catenulae TaxID=66875 RepID=A0ABV2YYK6_9ACTN|nr:glycosyltransferase [Streptomyces catenulae]